MANYVKTEDGYKEIGFIADETVLASGVLEGFKGPTFTNTGVLLSDLKEWKAWGFRFYTQPLASYGYLGISIGGVKICTYNIMSAAVIVGWFDKNKQTIYVIDSCLNDSNIVIGSPFIKRNGLVVLNNENNDDAFLGMGRGIILNIGDLPDDTMVSFYNTDNIPLGNTILWEIRGLIK